MARVHTSHPELSLTLGNSGLTDVDLGVRRRRGVAVPVLDLGGVPTPVIMTVTVDFRLKHR